MMGPPTPTMVALLAITERPPAQRKESAAKLLTDRVMTRDELIKLGLLSDTYIN